MNAMRREIAYLDHNATTPLRPEAIEAAAAALERVGNPSSVHGAGRRARALIDRARADVAALINAAEEEIVFTSGGTEANNLALLGCAEANGVTDLIVSTIEHDAVRSAARASGLTLHWLKATAAGEADLEALGHLLAEVSGRGGRALVSLMLANNETGVIQPVAEAARLTHEHGGLLHTDAVQGPGKIDVDMAVLDADLLCLSAHKFGGPPGAGALVLRGGLAIEPRALGGGQEFNRRAGTENLPGIAGFGAACAAVQAGGPPTERLGALRDRLETRVLETAPELRIFGRDAPRLANTCCLAHPAMPAETLVMALDLAGVAVSAGAACSSGKVTPSHVLSAMGEPPEMARAAIRISLGWNSTEDDIDRFVTAWRAATWRRAADMAVAATEG